MGTLYLVRHGQASLGADNYDQLSELGQRQSQRLGAYFARVGLRFDYVLTGTLRRHAQTLQGIAHGMATSNANHALTVIPEIKPALNEYDSHAIIRSIQNQTPDKPRQPEQVQAYFRLLREGLSQWMQGSIQPEGMVSYAEFESGIVSTLQELLQSSHQSVLIVSSGGPISTSIGHVLDVPHPARIALNLQIRNSSVSEFHFSAKQHSLVSFNTLPHLDPVEHKNWITYA